MKKRILSILLLCCMVLTLLPTAAFAADTGKAIQLGTDALSKNVNTASAPTVYFGQDHENNPAAWRVIGYNGNGVASAQGDMTLLAAGNMSSVLQFADFGTNNRYASSYLKTAIDALAEKLTTEENTAVKKRTLTSGSYNGENTDCVAGEQVDNAVFWPLSTAEAFAVNQDLRIVDKEHTDWAISYWWLRSPGSFDFYVAFVRGNGEVYYSGFDFTTKQYGVRPAFNLNLNAVLFTSAAVGGKPGGGLTPISEYTDNKWKLTLLDNSRNFDVTEKTANGYPGDTVKLNYSGATTGTNEYISVIIADNSGAQYYGRVAQPTEATGTVDIKIPSDLVAGNYTLKVFNEQCNGDYETDYASKFTDISLTVEKVDEQFSLAPGGTYYFDLSSASIPGTVNDALPDKTMHYVPFTYTGTVHAYNLTSAMATTEEDAEQNEYDHSLFVADYAVTHTVSWDDLNNAGLIFGKDYAAGGVDYTLRAPSVGSGSTGSVESQRGTPQSNEWDRILDKDDGYIKNWKYMFSWGQDTYSAFSSGSGRALRGYFSARLWFSSYATDSGPSDGFRPVLEVLNPGTLGSNGLKAVTLDLGGGKLGGSTDTIQIIVKTGESFTAPASEGLTRPDGNTGNYFKWRGSDGELYAPDDNVPADVTKLTAQFDEQFTLAPGGTYYFDLSGVSIPGTADDALPDKTMHYVPFTYAGTVDAYKLTSAMAATDEYAETNKYAHSLFVADYTVTHTVSWDELNAGRLIFGRDYAAGGVDYILRAPSVGSGRIGSAESQRGTPPSNEWDRILDKNDGYIKNWFGMYSWGQDTLSTSASDRAARGYFPPGGWSSAPASHQDAVAGFRPVLEVLNPGSLGSDGLKAVTLDLGGGKLGDESSIQIIVETGSVFTAPASDGLTRPDGNTGNYFMWRDNDSQLYAPGDYVPADVTKLTAQFNLPEQFTLAPGGTYYFDLSGAGIPGTANDALPDATLHYVPFTYAGMVNAYKLTSAMETTEEYAEKNKYDHSLFVAEYNVTRAVSWTDLNTAGLIFGKDYTSDGVDYTLRAPSVGSASTGAYDLERGTPQSNEWDKILDKGSGYIQNWKEIESWGQDIRENWDASAHRGYMSARYWNCSADTLSQPYQGFRPILEVLGLDTLGDDGLKAVTLDLGSGKLGDESSIQIIVETGSAFTAPASDGLTRPDGNTDNYFKWLGSDGELYEPGDNVSADVSKLTAQFAPSSHSVTITTDTLPDGKVGETYSQTLTANGTAPITWSIDGGLPAGLSLNADTGEISGTPTADGTAKFTVKATNSAGSDTKELSITIAKAAPAEYTVTVTSGGNGTASASPAKAVAGAEITLTAMPNEGYRFKEWEVISGGVTIVDDKFTMPNNNVEVKAIFEEDTPPAPTEHTVTVTSGGNGTASASPAKAVAGTEITLTAMPNEGYHFKEWQVISGDVTIVDNKFTMPDSNVEVKAIFEEDAPPAPTDPAKPSISVTGTYTYNGSEHTATVSGYDPATMDISGNTATDAGDYTVRVTSQTGKWADGSTEAVTAVWSIGKATQEAPDGLSSVAPATEGGSDGKITGVTDKMEYRMAGESIYTACSGTEIENLSAGNYFVRYAEDHNHFASPDAEVTVGEGKPLADFTITFNGNGGSGSMEPVTVKAGTNYILPACGFTAPADQEFKAWEIGGAEYKVGDSYTVDRDTEIKALWENSVITPTTYTVTVGNDGNGTGTATPSTAAAGTTITLTATPNKGYHFKEWQVISGGVTIKDDKFLMPDSNVEVSAIFEKDAPPVPTEFNITVKTDGNGTASASHAKAVVGTEIRLTATPNTGYHFKEWQVISGGVTIKDNKFLMPSANVEVKAIFEKDAPPAPTEFTITVTSGGNGTASASHAKAVAGTEIRLTATPKTGYHFKEWEVISGGVTIVDDKFLMPNDNVEVKAIFEKDAPPAPTDPAKPSISVIGTYTYNGSEHTATVIGYDSATMDITGNTATDAGDYTVSVTSQTGKWADGSTDAVTAAWSIGKATQEAPTGLIGVAPTTEGGGDGKITGVTDKMEYRMAGESSYTACGGTEIENLSAGNYFVRYAEDNNHFASSDAEVTVGDGEPLADFIITFNGNGGSGSMGPVTVKAGTNYILPECGFTAPADQEFQAWEIGGTEYKVGDFYTVRGDTEIKALWENSVITPTTYTVTVSNDGKGTGTASPSTAAAGTMISLTATPNEGYHFKEWQVISGGVTIKDDKFTMPSANVEVKAIFEKDAPPAPTEYTITVTSGDNGTASASHAKAVVGTEIRLTATPNTGYHLKEWQVISGGVTIKDDKFLMPNDNVEVKAIFEKDAPPAPTEFTITFDGNGGTPSVDSMTTTNQKLTSLPSASRSGSYSFDGWYTKKNGGTNVTTATVFSANTTVYAHWTYTGGGGGGSGYSYYTIKATAGAGGSISPSGNVSVREGRDQTFTITPDKGYAVANVKIDGKSIGAVKSYTFENVSRTHTIEVIFMKANGNPQTGVFVDVATGSYYEDAVDWAVENGITKGTDDTHFSPDGICTRAQAVTFLWRAAGSPEPETRAMPFNDVPVGSYYYDAVLWAVENGITKGTSDTTFSPNMTCTRAQIVAFLWRSEKSPAAGTANPFADVKSTAYYADAVLWAVKENITKGTTSTTFSPNADCTRAQIVTFLWRCKK